MVRSCKLSYNATSSCNWTYMELISRLDFCAECLHSFITETLGRTEKDDILPLGFTFSYPCS